MSNNMYVGLHVIDKHSGKEGIVTVVTVGEYALAEMISSMDSGFDYTIPYGEPELSHEAFAEIYDTAPFIMPWENAYFMM